MATIKWQCITCGKKYDKKHLARLHIILVPQHREFREVVTGG